MPRPSRLLLPLLLALGLPGCGALFGPGELGRLEQARRHWVRSGVTSYEMTVFRGCFCAFVYPLGVRLLVVSEAVASRTDLDTGGPIATEAERYYPGVAGLFDLIEETIRGGAYQVDVRYDEQYGVPLTISVDVIKNAIDDEFGYTVSEFRPLR